jgi:hypothetical protein
MAEQAGQTPRNIEEWRKRIEERVDKHHRDLYEGNGKPSLCTRIELMEKTLDRLTSNLTKLFLLGMATLGSTLASLVVFWVTKK